MIAWPEQLVEDVARRRAVLFIGAGVSRNSTTPDGKRPPGWEEFLRDCCDTLVSNREHIEDLLDRRDFLSACEVLRSRLEDEWFRLLTQAFSSPGYPPAEIHHSLFALDLRAVLTQNFDKIYDTYAQAEAHGSVLVKNYYDADVSLMLRGDYRSVIKVHGTIDEPSRTIFTRADYATLRNQHKSFQSLLDALLLTHTFLFIGCSLDDPDLRLFLENHGLVYPSAPVHFMTSPVGEVHGSMDAILRSSSNIRLLRYDPVDGHSQLLDSLRDLVTRVEDVRAELGITQNW